MIPSKYNLEVKDGNQIIVFNTRTGAMISLDEGEYDDFKNSSSEMVQDLSGLGFYVDEGTDEFSEIILGREKDISARGQADLDVYRIFTTTGCNAKCPYCFEKGYYKEPMTDETALAVSKFISGYSASKKIHIGWFGGEPLTNINPMNIIHKALSDKGFEVTSSIISNGLLFNRPEVRQSINSWNLQSVQVTLDGLESTHDKCKGIGEGSFRETLDSIDYLISINVKVIIRLNISPDNFGEMPGLIDLLRDRYGNSVVVYAAALYQANFSSPKEAYGKIISKLWDCGFSHYYERLVTTKHASGCGLVYNPRALVISPKGTLYKCPETINYPNLSLGDVYTGVKNQIELERWISPLVPDMCRGCKLLPICQGGCRASYFKLNSIPICNRNRDNIEDIIRLIYKHSNSID